ncbi:HPr family phosphocarrier protein [Paenibacillus alkaliterrae]|uniref:HPr family phosphocarrier protein n=1 Tax=Paenibacillus alkaliterrae TaxID=320909 RepID=UPI001F304328|nr:HPr family phosphocarrier protein [Paenibacillus alkaliterrae]MCF2938434.1 HPr family phosphocarrier protein [Paenibacillus alkaliterrae]
MFICEVIIECQSGLHARPAKLLALAAQQFSAEIKIQFGERQALGKSIISLLQLGAPKGALLRISAEGEDEIEAVKSLGDMVKAFE